ncbi:hypothetical protein LCGC14_1873360 [marine sediment metagenome]|uniref:Uncharacterized protein n=1 Tax=marine sediment metagenome TaxID=412755 RepID=A0A0F9G4G4_9ZZZZ
MLRMRSQDTSLKPPKPWEYQDLDDYIYRCNFCHHVCFKRVTPSGQSPTKTGDYGDNAVPTPSAYVDEQYVATSIGFVAASGSTPAYLTDSLAKFGAKYFEASSNIRIATGSGTNDGDFTIHDRGVSRDKILLISTDSLTTESAATAGTVTISRLIKQPNITTGCSFCGSLNSK